MTRKRKDFVVHVDSQTFMIREGESRRISIPMRMTLNKGILYIAQSDIYAHTGEPAPEGAPAPTLPDLKISRGEK